MSTGSIKEVLAKAERGEPLSQDEQTLLEDFQQYQERLKPSPSGHLWRISGEPSRPPDLQNVRYGPHERHVLDLWLSPSKEPAPLLTCFHGGGFRAGEKTLQFALRPLALQAGLAVACINYRLSQHGIYPASMEDGARAVQFLRLHAAEWNLDPRRFAACGNSAGAGISLWVGFRKDMAQPESADPVARQSTRLCCTIVYGGQTSYDPRFIRQIVQGPAYKHPAVLQFLGITEQDIDAPSEEQARRMEEASPINHVTRDAPPAYLVYGSENKPTTPETDSGAGIHHPAFGVALKKKMDALGLECHLRCLGDDPTPFPTEMEFLLKHLNAR